MGKDKEREEPRNDPQPWRSLVSLAAGIVLLVAIALLMIWVGTLVIS